MEGRNNLRLELEYDQTLYLVVGGKEQDSKMLKEDGNLVVFESLWHAGPLVQDLKTLGIKTRMVPMRLDALYCLASGMDLGLWVLRHDGTVTSVDDIIFP
jgi:hypothetical protein